MLLISLSDRHAGWAVLLLPGSWYTDRELSHGETKDIPKIINEITGSLNHNSSPLTDNLVLLP